MEICERCSELFLDYLYDLLDEAEAAEVRTHLEQCAACQACLSQAQGQQQLLATAARLYQSVPAFQPPAPVPAQPSSSAETLSLQQETLVEVPSAPAPVPARKPLRLAPWLAVAASLLVAVLAGNAMYQSGLAEHREALESAKRQAKQIDNEYAELSEKHTKLVQELPVKLQARKLQVQVSGPAIYNPQINNSLHIITNNLTGKEVPSDVTLRLQQPSGQVIFEEKNPDTTGNVTLALPPKLTEKTGEKLSLEVEASSIWAVEKVQQELIVAAPGYVTQIVTSKPAYETGELLFFRTLTLEQFTLKPPQKSFHLNFALVNAEGKVVKKLPGQSQPNGIAGGEFAITPDLADGLYTVRVEEIPGNSPQYHFAPQSFPVEIRHLETPRVALFKDFSPGAKVDFAIQGGQNIANQPLTVTVRVMDEQGEESKAKARPEQMRADPFGNVQGTLTVPKVMSAKAQAELEVEIHDGTENPKFIQSVPLVVPKWDAAFFPEGGQLVAGLPNRVYCQVSAARATATTLTGQLVSDSGKVIATVTLTPHQSKKPAHQLSGSFLFTPQEGETYTFRVLQGKKAVVETVLPPARPGGLVLSVADPVAAEKEPVQFTVYSTEENRPVLVVATCRGQVVGQQLALAQPQGSKLELNPAGANGVIRLTVYQPGDQALIPLAERLLYRAPEKKLNVSFSSKQEKLAPGQKAELLVQSETETQKPAPAFALALVVEENSAHGKDSDSQLQLPAYFLVTSQIKEPTDLDEANIFLGSVPESAAALDRFLAIQGWRTFLKEDGLKATWMENLVKESNQPAGAPALFFCDNFDSAKGQFEKSLALEINNLEQKRNEELKQVQLKKAEANDRLRAARLALGRFEDQTRMYFGLAAGVGLLAVLGMGFFLFVIGLWRVIRNQGSAQLPFVGAFASLALCLLLLSTAGFFRPDGIEDAGKFAFSELPAPPMPPSAEELARKSLPELKRLPNEVFALKSQKPDSLVEMDSGKQPLAGDKGKGTPSRMKSAEATKKATVEKQLGMLPKASMPLIKKDADLKDKQTITAFEGKSTKNLRYQNAWQLQEQMTQQAEFAPGFGAKKPDDSKSPPVQPTTAPPAAPLHLPGAGGGNSAKGVQMQAFGAYASNHARLFTYETAQQDILPPDTLLWHPDLFLENGQALISFDLPPHSAHYRVFLIGHDQDGRLGYCEGTFEVQAK